MAATMEQAFHELAARISNVEQLNASVDPVKTKGDLEVVIEEMKKIRARLFEVERNGPTGHSAKKKLRDVKSQDVEKYDGDTDKYDDWSFSVNTFLDDHDILYHDLGVGREERRSLRAQRLGRQCHRMWGFLALHAGNVA